VLAQGAVLLMGPRRSSTLYPSISIESISRHGEMENRAAARSILGPQAGAMRFDDGTANRQADAHAGGLRRHEGLEQIAPDVRCETRPRVGNADLNPAAVSAQRGDRQLTLLTRCHGLDRIAHQVEQD